jgi:hypothetical protein
MTTQTAPTPISERLRTYLHEFSPVVGITPETITADQVPRWKRVAAMVLRVPARTREALPHRVRRERVADRSRLSWNAEKAPGWPQAEFQGAAKIVAHRPAWYK